MFDYLVVGAGFAGCVVAERLARVLDRRVLCSPSKVQPIAASPFFFCPNGPLPPLCNCEVLAWELMLSAPDTRSYSGIHVVLTAVTDSLHISSHNVRLMTAAANLTNNRHAARRNPSNEGISAQLGCF